MININNLNRKMIMLIGLLIISSLTACSNSNTQDINLIDNSYIILPTIIKQPSPSSTIENPLVPALVISITDGDTIRVEIEGVNYRVRYIGIDTPEIKSNDWLNAEATEANRLLVEGKVVYLETDISNIDRFDRLLRYVYLADGTFVNAELVRQGLAISKAYPPDVKYLIELNNIQLEAKLAGLGLWGVRPPTLDVKTPPPPISTSPAGEGSTDSTIKIVDIFNDGLVELVESDEYALIMNTGSINVNLFGWRINAGAPDQDFVFPEYILQPGDVCRVYTNETHSESCGFSFNILNAIWNNGGDCGYLFSTDGIEVDSYCY